MSRDSRTPEKVLKGLNPCHWNFRRENRYEKMFEETVGKIFPNFVKHAFTDSENMINLKKTFPEI